MNPKKHSTFNPKTEVGVEIEMVNRQSDAVGSALRCAPPPANRRILSYHDGAHGVTRPTTAGSPKSSRHSLLNFGF
ncbi:MAG TPA: hypothetical protein VF988_10310, partial [Verrucomicrobiae bacterium]